MEYPKEIAEAIIKVMGAGNYIQKTGYNEFHRYKFAKFGDVLDTLQPLLVDAGLVIIQHEVGMEMMDNGNAMAVHYEFILAHKSGAVWPDKIAQTGMASCRTSKGTFDDKAANKCHTAARKYFLLALFQVPTGDDYRESAHDGDPDHEAAPQYVPPPRYQPNQSKLEAPLSRLDHVEQLVAERQGPFPDTIGEVKPVIQRGPLMNEAEIAAAMQDDFWARRSYLVIVPFLPGGKYHNWKGYADELARLIDAAPNVEALSKLMADNQGNLQQFKTSAAKLAGEVKSVYTTRAKHLSV